MLPELVVDKLFTLQLLFSLDPDRGLGLSGLSLEPLGPHSENIFGRKVLDVVLCFVELLVQSVDDEPKDGLYEFEESCAVVAFFSPYALLQEDSSRRYLLVRPLSDSRCPVLYPAMYSPLPDD